MPHRKMTLREYENMIDGMNRSTRACLEPLLDASFFSRAIADHGNYGLLPLFRGYNARPGGKETQLFGAQRKLRELFNAAQELAQRKVELRPGWEFSAWGYQNDVVDFARMVVDPFALENATLFCSSPELMVGFQKLHDTVELAYWRSTGKREYPGNALDYVAEAMTNALKNLVLRKRERVSLPAS